MSPGQLDLGIITVHCFWGWCTHVESAIDPSTAHDLMEEHYRARHQAEIDRIVGPTNPHLRLFPR